MPTLLQVFRVFIIHSFLTSFLQQSLERQKTAEKERLFLVYAKQWWREFLEIRPSHQSKLVKIFAQVSFFPAGNESNYFVVFNHNCTWMCAYLL